MKRYILIIAILAILTALYFLFFYGDKQENTSIDKNVNKQTSYRIDGTMWFIDSLGDTLSKLSIEVANDYYSQARGLMYRQSMPDTVGMLFIYEDYNYRSFWMKNTHIPLDLVFISDNYKISQVHEYAIPYSEESIVSKQKAKYVVEVNAGYTDRKKVAAGGKITLNLK